MSELIDLARRGEEVVILRDSRPVAAIQRVDAADFRPLRITDRQARRLIELSETEPKVTFSSARAAVKFLKKDMQRKR